MPSTPLLCILSVESSTAADQALGKFAQFLGLQADMVSLHRESDEPPAMRPMPGGRILALHCAALPRLVQQRWFPGFLDKAALVFVYGFAPTTGESPELKWLTGGALSGVSAVAAQRLQFTVHADVGFGAFPVSGRSFCADSASAAVFSAPAPGSDIESYLTANGQPCFVALRRGRSLLFLLAGAELPDIDTALSPGSSLRPCYVPLLAATIFLRGAFGPWCWTSPVTGATFIVDDPYLKKRYGFIQYATLMRELEGMCGALTVAFIPYNRRRSDRHTVALLHAHSDRFSIAVHGCDHTGGEFASLEESWLAGTTACALERMEDHARRTGMPFDNVMVFPQGRFSTKAIGALRSCGLSAAVNSTAWPEDWQEDPLTIRDLLDVAVTRYDRFPIFVRRYPRDVFDFAFDAFFQKPILAVEHHGFFRNGCGPLTEFIRDLSTLEPKLQWMPLGRTLASSCVVKRTGDSRSALRHFTPVFRFMNSTPKSLTLALEKPEKEGLVEAVLVHGHKVPFEIAAGVLRYEAEVDAGKELNVAVIYRQTPRAIRRPSWKYRISAATRRRLSDVRDNQLARSKRLLSVAEKLKETLVRRSKLGRNSH